MTNMLWDVKSARDLSCQLLGNTAWSFAVKGEPSITVMVIQIPAKALSTDFKAQVIASGYRACLGKSFNNGDDTISPFVGDFTPCLE
jgi:hypothetical protein